MKLIRLSPGEIGKSLPRLSLSSRPGWDAGVRCMLLLGVVLVTFPATFFPIVPNHDTSWMIFLNLAHVHGWVPGWDYAFTYGPMGFLGVPVDVGDNLALSMIARLVYFGIWWGMLGLFAFRIRPLWLAAVFLLTSGIGGFAPDPTDVEPGRIILGTVIGFSVLSLRERNAWWAVPAAIMTAVALLSKLSTGVAAASALAAWTLIMVLKGARRPDLARLAAVWGVFLAAFLVLFRWFGGPLGALPDYLKFSREIVSGFSANMGWIDMDQFAAGVQVGLGFVGLGWFAWSLAAAWCRRSPLFYFLALMSPSVFIAFKSAFVRQDPGHVGNALFFLPVLLPLLLIVPLRGIRRRRTALAVVAVSGVCLASVVWPGKEPISTNVARFLTRGAGNLGSLSDWSAARAETARLTAENGRAVALPQEFLDRIGAKPADTFPHEISILHFNGLTPSLRFVPQSYQAYTPGIDARNAAHYESTGQAPAFILYLHSMIDNVHPGLRDSRAWLALYRWYDPVMSRGDLVLLERRKSDRLPVASGESTDTLEFGKTWQLPSPGPGVVECKAQIKMTLLGKLVNALFKVDSPVMKVEYSDGSSAMTWFSWQNIAEGALISDLPQNTNELLRFFVSGQGRQVTAITLFANPAFFEPVVPISWRRHLPPDR